MKKTINILLVAAVIVPVAFLFWPFAEWNNVMSVILRVIPSVAMQVLFCQMCKPNIVKTIPALLMGAFAVWGTYLFFTSPHWSNATFWGSLIADYVSPFIACLVALIACLLIKKKK
ncbi:MAG: hypothetical protein J6R05_03685 [Bacteroidaceae bacterium]|nr:hypothetical protein [Bacteroidaceae bacterium]